MNMLELVAAFLRALAATPASASFITPSLDALLANAATLAEAGDAGAQALEALTAQIKAMTHAGRDPTPEEWDTLKARSDAAHALIQASP